MARKKAANQKVSYVEKLENQVQSNQSRLSMILGALIVLVVGILVFNYFNKNKSDLGPAQQTEMKEDGKYTVKEGDTLFLIAEKYYNDGYKYTEIVKANNLASADLIEMGQVLEIPKVEAMTAVSEQPADTEWGPKITGNSYTVVAGDWLSKIAGRSYGDIYAYQKIADANKITNPDTIEIGQVLTIPR